jgi:hypothetical protein
MTTAAVRHMRSGAIVRIWTEDEDARLIAWIVAGHPLNRIAAALGRTESAVAQRRGILKDRIGAQRDGSPGAAAHWPARRGVPAPDTARAAGAVRRRLVARLSARPRGKFWTPGRDLALAQAMAAGAKAADLARDWRCAPEDVQARWLTLCPDRAQVGVVAELIALLAAEVADG